MTGVEDLRCSSWTRSRNVDPGGTAGSHGGYVLIDWPLPWPRDIADIPELALVARAARERGIRVQAVVPTDPVESRTSVYTWDPESGRYVGVEAPSGECATAAAMASLRGEPVPSCEPIGRIDVLICGHGRRDRCCGSLGTALQADLYRRERTTAPEQLRFRRTSHTGGHRFAPTAIVLPDGTSWGYLESSSLLGIVSQDLDVCAALPMYRGCSGLPSPAIQALEKSVFAVLGWSIFSFKRRGEEHADGTVSIEIVDSRGDTRRWRALAVTRRVVPVPICGSALTGDEKSEAEIGIDCLQEL